MSKVIKGINIIINDKNSDTFCLNELTINNGEKQHANVDHDINTRVKTFLLSFIAIVTTKTVTIMVTNLFIR